MSCLQTHDRKTQTPATCDISSALKFSPQPDVDRLFVEGFQPYSYWNLKSQRQTGYVEWRSLQSRMRRRFQTKRTWTFVLGVGWRLRDTLADILKRCGCVGFDSPRVVNN